MSHAMIKTFTAAAVLVILAGCGDGGSSGGGGGSAGQEKVVARAGDAEVTLAQFHDSYQKITPNFRPDISTLEGKRSFANDLVNQAILLDEGARMGGISDPNVQKAITQNRDQKMLAALYREEVETKVEVGGKDVADLYEKRQNNIKLSHILVDSTERAASILEEIRSGKKTYEEAAAAYSMDRNTSAQGGSLGEIYWSLALPDFQQYAFEMTEGEISEPYESSIGVHLVRLDEVIPQELGTLEEMRTGMRSEVRRQLENRRMREYVASLEADANLSWNDDGLRQLVDLMIEEAKQDIDTIPTAEQHLPDATDEQRAVKIVSFMGRDWTIGDHLAYLESQPPHYRPVGEIPVKGLKELIRTTQVQNELLLAEAYKRGYDKNEEIESERRRLEERVLVEQVHARFLQAADVPPEDVRALYDSTAAENPDAIMIPERIDMVVLVHTDEDVVREGLRRIKAGEAEDDVVAELTMDFRTAAAGGRTGLIARGNYSPQIEEAAFAAEPGSGWSEPIVTQSGTGAFRLVSKEEPRPATFDEVESQLTSNLAQARGEAAFEEWLKSERDRRGVEIYDDVLELIGKPIS
ncbi:MAG: hypothetical protein HKN12_02130 [Gemmatimonadetes bacterium]|nr:hypothetical protein [Gemmatimonadota bacterium]